MSAKKNISIEISEAINSLMDLELTIDKDEVTKRIVAQYASSVFSPEVNWCIWDSVRRMVSQFIKNNVVHREKYQEQYKLKGNGFDDVESYVSIRRNDKEVAVVLHKVTEEEINAKVGEMIASGRKEIQNATKLKAAWNYVVSFVNRN